MKLDEGCNFRQMSGHIGHDGRRLRCGKLFRSGVLSYFSATDHQQLRALEIRTIVDLRHTDERRREPTRWCTQSVTIVTGDEDTSPASLVRLALRTAPTSEEMRQAMIDVYRSMPETLAGRIQSLFECLYRDQVPLLVHCAAGKDRTGFAAAVILASLGVDRAGVLSDYLYTNEAVDLEGFVLEHHQTDPQRNPDFVHPLKLMDPDVRRALLCADAAYLDAAFEAIESPYGSVEEYLHRRVGIDAARLAHIRDALLE